MCCHYYYLCVHHYSNTRSQREVKNLPRDSNVICTGFVYHITLANYGMPEKWLSRQTFLRIAEVKGSELMISAVHCAWNMHRLIMCVGRRGYLPVYNQCKLEEQLSILFKSACKWSSIFFLLSESEKPLGHYRLKKKRRWTIKYKINNPPP